MIQVFINLISLIRALNERGNWKLIRHSRKQLMDFIFCRSGLNRVSPVLVFFLLVSFIKRTCSVDLALGNIWFPFPS